MSRYLYVRFLIITSFLACAISPFFAQRAPSPPVTFEFVNQNVRDVLYALSVYRAVPIVADDTVSGPATLQYSGTDFEAAFDAFLSINRLFAERGESSWTVSKIRVREGAGGTLNIDAFDLTSQQIFEHLSAKTGRTIVRDILPATKLSLRMSAVTVEEAIGIVMKPFADYEVVVSAAYVQVRKSTTPFAGRSEARSGALTVRESAGRFEVSGAEFTLGEALEALFREGKREYSSFVRPDTAIARLAFSGKTFEEALDLVLDQASAEAAQSGGTWFILPGQQSETLKKLRNGGKTWSRFALRYSAFDRVQPLLRTRFPDLEIAALPDGAGFFARVSPDENAELDGFLRTVDAVSFRGPVRLKYIKGEELLRSLPPAVTSENLVSSGNGNALFFVGSRERYAEFLKDLESIDRPKPRIRYDLLIMQYQDSSDLKWGFNVDARRLAPGDQTLVTGSLGNILKLNFDVISVLGYRFAAQLDAAISGNQANVFADTTLYGMSGQDIKFQNTNTYRYRDYYIDSQTNETVYTGVTREITSGLVLNVNGWVSGDGMITTTVNASVSKRGADVSSNSGNPPPTSEKTVTTQVLSRSGETVVLSGLRQNDSTLVEERVPLISRVPILGWFFRRSRVSKENNQMVIYLIPHVDLGLDSRDGDGLRARAAYERFVLPYLGKDR